MDWAKTTARRYKKHLRFGIWCDLYQRFYGNCVFSAWRINTKGFGSQNCSGWILDIVQFSLTFNFSFDCDHSRSPPSECFPNTTQHDIQHNAKVRRLKLCPTVNSQKTIPRPNGRAMRHLFWVLWRKETARCRHCTEISACLHLD